MKQHCRPGRPCNVAHVTSAPAPLARRRSQSRHFAATLLAARRTTGLGDRRRAGRHALRWCRVAGRCAGRTGLGVFWPAAVAEVTLADGGSCSASGSAAKSIPTPASGASSSRRATASSTRSGRISIGSTDDAIRAIGLSARRLRAGTDARTATSTATSADRRPGRGSRPRHADAWRRAAPCGHGTERRAAKVGRRESHRIAAELLALSTPACTMAAATESRLHLQYRRPSTDRTAARRLHHDCAGRLDSATRSRSSRPRPTRSSSSRIGWWPNSSSGWPAAARTWPC